MKQRCRNPKSPLAKWYSEKGIDFIDRWLDFAEFYKDMGPAPSGAYLDRINNSLGYSPENCRWATKRQSMVNRTFVATELPIGIKKTKIGNFQARIKIYGKEYTVGTFKSLEEAITARKIWEDTYAV